MNDKMLEVNKNCLTNLLNEKKIQINPITHDDFIAKYTYDAISLEGINKVPYEAVLRLIKTGVLVGYSKREENEILNHVEAFNYVLKLLERNRDITEEQLKDIHDNLLKNIMIGGVYRNVNIQIIGAAHQPPDNIKVYDRMKRLFENLEKSELDDFDKGIYLHAELAKIHPYVDGNGKLSRLILNYYLIKAGYLPVSIPINEREIYFKHIEAYKVLKDIQPITNYIKNLLIVRYEKMIEDLDK